MVLEYRRPATEAVGAYARATERLNALREEWIMLVMMVQR